MLFRRLFKGCGSAGCEVIANPTVNEGSREFEINNWRISRFVCDTLVPVVGVHPFPLNELMLMVAAVCRVQPTHVFEWGTHIGKSARVFYETARTFGLETEVHSIDLPEDVDHVEHPGQNRGQLVKGLQNVHLHEGDGLETALDIYSRLGTGTTSPLFFVDGDHAYSSVLRELKGIIANVPGASIVLHDTFNQSEDSGYNTGPHAAICEVLEQNPGLFSILTQNLGLPGMTFLWRRKSA